MTPHDSTSLFQKTLGRAMVAIAFAIVVVLLLLWLAGAFHRKIDDAKHIRAEAVPAERSIGDARLVDVRTIRLPREESSVGTIKSVHETTMASKILAKVTEVRVTAGQHVRQSEVLMRLDDADLRARLQQAEAEATAALAKRDQAQIEYARVAALKEQKAAAKIEWDRVQSALKSAEAELTRARQAVAEAREILGYATVVAPITGVVIDKKVEVGDTVTPGQPLVSLFDPTRMQLVASVRESLTQRLAVGQTVEVEIDALNKRCQGRVSEIVPEAEAVSRTFSVKVTGPCPPGIYTGMFGRLLIPLDQEEILVVPRQALRAVGQLDIVDVAVGNSLRRRTVQLGRTIGDEVEVLSGLKEGEQVAISPDAHGGT